MSAAKGEYEWRRLTGCYDRIRRAGYRPGAGEDGDIRGFLLRTEDDYRFVVRQGLHRTPALAVLGYDKIRVKFFPGLPRAVFLADAAYWPQVHGGFVSFELAERIFSLFFEDDGRDKARRLGLL